MNREEDLKSKIIMRDLCENNQNIFEGEIPDRFIQDYCVAKFCESGQLILEVI